MDQSIKAYIKQLVQEAIEQSASSLNNLPPGTGRKQYVIANWKMNKNIQETLEFLQQLKEGNGVEVVVCPPAPLLYPAKLYVQGQKKEIQIGAQNVHQEDKGAYTGETAASLLKEIGCSHCIIGHSERRQYAQEDDATVNQKAKQALKRGLTPVICIGETLEQKQQDQTEKVLTKQILGAMDGMDVSQVVFAYEPVWAIGTGESATAAEAQRIHGYIRSVLEYLDVQNAEKVSILYGGSVNENNAQEFASMTDIDGVLVGGASLQVDSFQKIIAVFAKGA
ncbi:triose-phosphate isomerase [Sutcliffiella horikoshii]|uniref:Triosephosphate isomerase n=1 Tax=Sutcliffiella horikoshii TaxID=79883 RepID=A0ABN4ZKD1_9BACI|nr:triose-phosphate isomerase [Sutcliffiella horikoshii]ART78390.1 triose-phosphate isomerase [Sutcliffiella horikoshii]